ncbi:MAG: DUF805 domain-containing protein [Kiritimatiellae bacterium]|nr:DUF805 domain-containing protein [Kiritimatiellia bacterium]
MKYWLKCMKNYAVFSGRARRKEYWHFLLVNSIVPVIASFAIGYSAGGGDTGLPDKSALTLWNMVAQLWAMGTALPGWAVSVRRLHDTGRSGWWALLGIPTAIGGICGIQILLWIGMIPAMIPGVMAAFFNSQPGANAYGANPKE